MFYIRYQARYVNGVLQTYETSLSPPPTTDDYPEAKPLKVLRTQDGGTVVQRPNVDDRPRAWIGRNYPSSVTAYENQWQLFVSLEYRNGVTNNLPAAVEIWEDTSGVGGFARVDRSGNRIYTKVKLTQVDRQPRPTGGVVLYESRA